jgi:hypothetical protein
VVRLSQDLHCPLFAVVRNEHAHASPLFRWQRIPDIGNSLDQLIPANLFAKVSVILERELSHRTASPNFSPLGRRGMNFVGMVSCEIVREVRLRS